MKICPCCHKELLNEEDVMNSISHLDNETYICNACGQVESLIHLDLKNITVEQADNYYKLKKELKSGN
ncbi:MAG: hypothetical protein O6761_07850 [Thaumarchaeota archaeon]|nr:hypothetical protein [Nitrososphaerota archaeon]